MARKPFEQAAEARILAGTNGWQGRHATALIFPQNFEVAITGLARSWYQYAVIHELRCESLIGDDGVLGPAWEDIGDSLRTLLNGECGRLDAGTMDSFILNTMRDFGLGGKQ